MHSKFKTVLKKFVPPILFQLSGNERLHLTGKYESWDQAKAASTGYKSNIILEKTIQALLKVKSGEAVYERDSVLFDEIQYSWPLLAGLMWIAAMYSGRLNVLDFGGSLGSAYFQNRQLLAKLPAVHWNIVEQPEHVKAGKEHFEDNYLKFFTSIEECYEVARPNVVLLGSVLQYIDNPYKILREVSDLGCEHVIIDRTPFWDGSFDRLCVQHVPTCIYKASYPSWIFSKSLFNSELSKLGFKVVAKFENDDRLTGPIPFSYRGMILEK
jgi:putative methyltransferase (TIGR04325 family)